MKDPDGFDLQISNGAGHAKDRRTPSTAVLKEPLPFAATGWRTVWLDHISFGVRDYKKSASFYENLLGWSPTYDEGSQIELMIGDIGDIIIRGGNPLDPMFGKSEARRTGIDHISFGIAPWDTDGVKAELEKRGLPAAIDTSSKHKAADGTWVADEIHTAAFKSYHTETPNGYNLQISYVPHDNRLALANAVNPKKVSGSDVAAVRSSPLQTQKLTGDVAKPGMYIVRQHLPAGGLVPPHFHSADRYIAILSGVLTVCNSATVSVETATAHKAGDVFPEPARAVHCSWARDGDVDYLEMGIGPVTTTPAPK